MFAINVILWIVLVSAVTGLIALLCELKNKDNVIADRGVYERVVKRPLDAFLAMGALMVFGPVLLITALLVRIKLGSPVLFKQKRSGRNEKIFSLYKFRTMTDKKDEEGNLLSDEIRLTSFGKKLRSTSLDELPELINIIKGDMSIVGPRPLLVKYIPWYTDEQHKRHCVRPGLTGYAQAHGRNAVDWDDKFRMDVEYTSNITFLGDVKIIVDTVKLVFLREGISSDTSATMEDFEEYCKSKGRTAKV